MIYLNRSDMFGGVRAFALNISLLFIFMIQSRKIPVKQKKYTKMSKKVFTILVK